MPHKDISNNSVVNESSITVINNSNKSQIETLLESNSKANYSETNTQPIIINTTIQNNNEMEDVSTQPPKEAKNNFLAPNSYTSNNNLEGASPIAIQPPPPPTALNQFSFNPNSDAFLSNAENINSLLNSKSKIEGEQNNNLKENKVNSSLISPSNVHLLPQDNLYSQSYQPSMTHDITNSITGGRLSSSFTYKNNLLANVNTSKKSSFSMKGIPIGENTAIKSHRMHRKRTMRLTKQAQSEVSEFYNFDVNLLLQISVEQWVDFITIITFFLWQHPNVHPSETFMDDAYDIISEADTKEKNYFFAYRRFLYQFIIKTSPNPFVVLYGIVYLFKLREGVPDSVVTPRSETFVFPVVIMIADKFIQDVHQLPAKYWALAAKMNTDDLILFQRKIMKYLGYSLLVTYEEIDNVVTLLEEFVHRDLELDEINNSISSPSSSNSYPTPPMSQQNSVEFGFSMFNDNIDSTNLLDVKEAEILIYTFRKMLNEQPEYIPPVITSSSRSRKHRSMTPIIGRYGDDEGMEGDDEREDYGYIDRRDSPAVIPSYSFKNSIPLPINHGSHPKFSSSVPKSMNIDNRSKRLSVGHYSNISVSPYYSNNDDSFTQRPLNNYNPNRRSVNDPFFVYEGKNPHHKHEDIEFKKYSNGSGKKISMLSKAMNLLKNDKSKNEKSKSEKIKSKSSKNSFGKSSTPSTLPRNIKHTKLKSKSASTLNIHGDRESPNPHSVTDVQSSFGPYYTGSAKSNKRNSKSLVPINNNRYSMTTSISNNSHNNKRYSLPVYATNFKFNGNGDTCYSNPPETQTQTISIINKKVDGAQTPEDYLFKDPSSHYQNPAVNLEYKKSPVKPKLVTKLVSKNTEKVSENSGNKNKTSHKKSFDDTQGPVIANTPVSQIDRSLEKEKEHEPNPESESELESETEQNNYFDYNQAVNMLKSIPFGDESFVKNIRRDDSEEVANFVKATNTNGLKSKTSKTSFLFSKRKNPLKSGSHSNITEGNVNSKRHNKSKSFINTGSGTRKPSNGKKFYTLGHNHSEASMNNGYFVEKEKERKFFKGNYFSREYDDDYEDEIEEINEVEEEEEYIQNNKYDDNPRSIRYAKPNGSNKSMKWIGKIMKTIQLKK